MGNDFRRCQACGRPRRRELYKLARRLGAFKPTPAPGVKLKDGTLASDDDEGLARWAEHFAAHLGGKQVEKVKVSSAARHGDEQMLQLSNILDLSPEASKPNVYFTWLAVGQSVLGRQLRDPLSNVPRRDLEPRNTCAAHLVGLSATLCHEWLMDVNFKRALQLQTEFINLLPRNS